MNTIKNDARKYTLEEIHEIIIEASNASGQDAVDLIWKQFMGCARLPHVIRDLMERGIATRKKAPKYMDAEHDWMAKNKPHVAEERRVWQQEYAVKVAAEQVKFNRQFGNSIQEVLDEYANSVLKKWKICNGIELGKASKRDINEAISFQKSRGETDLRKSAFYAEISARMDGSQKVSDVITPRDAELLWLQFNDAPVTVNVHEASRAA